MIICDKPVMGAGVPYYPRPLSLLEQRITGVLTEAEDAALKKKADEVLNAWYCNGDTVHVFLKEWLDQVLFAYGLSKSSVESILRSLFIALERYRSQQSMSPSSISDSIVDTADNDFDEVSGMIADVEHKYSSVFKAQVPDATEIGVSADGGIEPVSQDGEVPQPIQQKRKKHVSKKNRHPTTLAQQRCE